MTVLPRDIASTERRGWSLCKCLVVDLLCLDDEPKFISGRGWAHRYPSARPTRPHLAALALIMGNRSGYYLDDTNSCPGVNESPADRNHARFVINVASGYEADRASQQRKESLAANKKNVLVND